MKRIVRVRAVIPYQGDFLFVQHQHDSSFWALPGGKVDDGEALQDAMKRELVEELGVEPELGKLLYVHQLFMGQVESLEFFFEVTNGASYADVDIRSTTHGGAELARAEFIDPRRQHVLPDFLSGLAEDFAADDWPKIVVRSSSRL